MTQALASNEQKNETEGGKQREKRTGEKQNKMQSGAASMATLLFLGSKITISHPPPILPQFS